MSVNRRELTGRVVGKRFTTSSLRIHSGTDPESGPVRVVWNQGEAWRLRLINQGNDPWQLPGEDRLVTRDTIRDSAESGRALIVVGGRSSGLTSLCNWMAGDTQALSSLSVDLTEAQLRGETPGERIAAIALGLKRAAKAYLASRGVRAEIEADDPIDILRELSDRYGELELHAVIFRSFEALDDETALRFFGRLRALFEDPGRPLGSFGVVLLGQSIDALDPEQQRPVSTLLSTSDLYMPTSLFEPEVRDMLSISGGKGDVGRLMEWTGGDPLLVQTVLSLIAPRPVGESRCENLEDAIQILSGNRPPSMETWFKSLQARLNDESVRRIIDRLLRAGKYKDESFTPRIATLGLYVDGWIQFDPYNDLWTWRSECRRLLASEAYGERERL